MTEVFDTKIRRGPVDLYSIMSYLLTLKYDFTETEGLETVTRFDQSSSDLEEHMKKKINSLLT